MQNLTPFIFESVGIMAPNHPYWFVSSLGAIFAGGLRSESGQLQSFKKQFSMIKQLF